MKREELLVSNEWLMRKIAADPDIDTEAGMPLHVAKDPGPIMMALVELIREWPRDAKVRKLTDNAMRELTELRAENARLTTENAINKPCVVALEECEAKLKDAIDACISDAVEIGRLKAENARLREAIVKMLDARYPHELENAMSDARDALKGKGT